jgi:hypothetical protein
MTWCGVEEEFLSSRCAGAVSLVFGLFIWWWLGDWRPGILAYLPAGITAVALRDLWLQLRLPGDAGLAAHIVLAWFREHFPEKVIRGVAIRSVESDRFVVSVLHGHGRPGPRSYFSIRRPELIEITQLSVADWRPRGLK